jgi:putative Mg2+ transporter-C (MgtC) family protein
MKTEAINFIQFFSSYNTGILLKLTVSLTLGLIIGLEREMTNKTAGLRTHILLCLGCTVFTILSLNGFDNHAQQQGMIIQNDPARIAAQILTGIGFIGGGAVLHHGMNVYGLTTAATIWITAGIGMSVGTGNYQLAIITTLITFVVLVVIRQFEQSVLMQHINKGATIKASVICSKENVHEIQEWFYNEFKTIDEVDINIKPNKNNQVKLIYVVSMVDKNPVNAVHKKLLELKNIESISLKQISK